jgi:hypothetical protein
MDEKKPSKVNPMQQELERKRAYAASRGYLGFDALYEHATQAAKQALTPEVSMLNEAGEESATFGLSVMDRLKGVADVFRKSPPKSAKPKAEKPNMDIPAADRNEFEKRARDMLAQDPDNENLRRMIEDTRRREFSK